MQQRRRRRPPNEQTSKALISPRFDHGLFTKLSLKLAVMHFIGRSSLGLLFRCLWLTTAFICVVQFNAPPFSRKATIDHDRHRTMPPLSGLLFHSTTCEFPRNAMFISRERHRFSKVHFKGLRTSLPASKDSQFAAAPPEKG